MMNNSIRLRQIEADDLDCFFQFQLDPKANEMAAFTAVDPTDKAAFERHWSKVLADESITARTILYNGRVSGNIVCHSWFGDPELSYWIDQAVWGKGVGTAAVNLFLDVITVRPLYARVVKDNIGSKRVLEKNGFVVSGEDRGFAHGRGEEVEEHILRLQ